MANKSRGTLTRTGAPPFYPPHDHKLCVCLLVLVSTFTLIEKVEGCIIVEPYPQRRNTQKYSIHMSKCNLSVREQEGGAVLGVAEGRIVIRASVICPSMNIREYQKPLHGKS